MTDKCLYNPPVAFFAYNRPHHTHKCLNALSKCEGISHTPLYIYIDAPRYEGDNLKNQQVYEVSSEFDWPGPVKKIIRRSSNFGLAKNISDGVTEVLKLNERIIVLEDDILVAPTFIKYMNAALASYEERQEVMHINGYVPESLGQSILPAQFFTRFMHCWGWGTWESSWNKLKTDPHFLLTSISERKDKNQFSLNSSIDLEGQLMSNIKGQINTWAVLWSASIFLSDGLCLSPKVSLVRNIGLDGSGVHYNSTSNEPNKSEIKSLGHFNLLKSIPVKLNSFGSFYFEMHYSLGNKPSLFSILKFCALRVFRRLRIA